MALALMASHGVEARAIDGDRLSLDVARYCYTSVWVPLKDLWRAIRRTSTSTGRSRGVVVRRI